MSLTPEILKRIQRIDLRTRYLVEESFAGAYHSVFKGRGIEFDAVRNYEPGDDVRTIDWNVTARAGEPYVKRFAEERELTVMIVLDTSASTLFGSAGSLKRDLAAEIGAVLAYAAISNNDRVGLLCFSDQIELFIAPRKGRNHVLRLIRDLLTSQPRHKGTDIALALRTVNHVLKRRAIVFLMSDYLAPIDSYERDLRTICRRHDFIALMLTDPLEESWPSIGLVALRDAETGEEAWIDTHSSQWKRFYEENVRRFMAMRDQALRSAGADYISFAVGDDYVNTITRFFSQRIHQRKIT